MSIRSGGIIITQDLSARILVKSHPHTKQLDNGDKAYHAFSHLFNIVIDWQIHLFRKRDNISRSK